jgi:hypothetical protein
MLQNTPIKKSLINKILFSQISNLYLIIPLCVGFLLLYASLYYWSPRSNEEKGACVRRVIGHGTFYVDESVASNGDVDRILLNTKEPQYNHLCR